MTIHELLQAAGLTANDEIPIWDVDGTGEPTKKITAQQLAQAVVTLANLVSGVKGDAESTYRTGQVNLTPANIGALPASTTIPSKTSDLTNDSGFLTSSTGVTGVKGNAESSYRQGNVNLTPANLGAAPYYYIRNTADDRRLQFDANGINLWSYEAGSWSAKNIINNQGDLLDYYYNDSNEHVIGKFGSATLYRQIFTKNGYSDNVEAIVGYVNGTPINVYGIYTQNDGSRVAANHYYDGSSYSSLWVGANNYVYVRAHPAGTNMIAIVEYYR